MSGLILDQFGISSALPVTAARAAAARFSSCLPSGTWTTLTVLYSFTGGYQCGPWGNLVMDGAGSLYGATRCDGTNGLGSVFELTPSGPLGRTPRCTTFAWRHRSDGKWPYCNVVFDASGNLYGTASFAGDLNCFLGMGCGVVWEITP